MATKENARLKRKQSIRKRLSGSVERPRLSVYRSTQHIYVQVIDDSDAAKSNTLVASSTLDPSLVESLKGLKKRDQAKQAGCQPGPSHRAWRPVRRQPRLDD